jgi:phosphate:Na+ symporter
MFAVFPFFIQGIGWIMNTYMEMHPFAEHVNELGLTVKDPLYNSEHIPIALSIFHSTFNVLNVILLIGFVPFIAKTVERLIKSKGDDEDFTLEFIGRGLVQTPEISLAEAHNEIEKFAKLNLKGVEKISQLIEETESKKQQKLLEKIKNYEEHTDLIEIKVAEFLMELSRNQLSTESSRQVQSWLSVVNHMESIGDIYYQMSKSIEGKIEKKLYFEERHREALREMKDLVIESMDLMMVNLYLYPTQITMDSAIELEMTINKKRDKFRARNFKNIEKGRVTLETGLIYMDLINGYEKMADNVIHISQALRGDHLDLEDEITS